MVLISWLWLWVNPEMIKSFAFGSALLFITTEHSNASFTTDKAPLLQNPFLLQSTIASKQDTKILELYTRGKDRPPTWKEWSIFFRLKTVTSDTGADFRPSLFPLGARWVPHHEAPEHNVWDPLHKCILCAKNADAAITMGQALKCSSKLSQGRWKC